MHYFHRQHFMPTANEPDPGPAATAETFTIRFVPDETTASQTDADTDVDATDEGAIHVKVYKCGRCSAQFERSYQLKRHTFVDHSQSGAAVKERLRTTRLATNGGGTRPSTSPPAQRSQPQPPSSYTYVKPQLQPQANGAMRVLLPRAAVSPPLTIPVPMFLPPATHPIKITQRSQHDADHIAYLRRSRPDDCLFQCKLCSATSNSLDAVDAHLLLHNGTPFAFHCELCDEALASLALLQNHVHAHTCVGWAHRCGRCELRFEGAAALSMHGCLGKATPMCLQCRQTFVSFSLSTAHQHLHTGRRHYRCDACSLAFIHRATLAMHRQAECVGLR